MEMKARWLGRVAVLLGVTAVMVVLLILTGLFDPQPVGQLRQEITLARQTIDAESAPLIWLNEAVNVDAFSIRLTAAYQSGERDIVYGVVLGDETRFLVTAVSPLGYAAVWEQHSLATIHHFPFQTWPHVRPDENEIWLDVANGRATIRINRELLWQGEVAAASGQIGLWGESFGETAVIDFQSLQIFTSER